MNNDTFVNKNEFMIKTRSAIIGLTGFLLFPLLFVGSSITVIEYDFFFLPLFFPLTSILLGYIYFILIKHFEKEKNILFWLIEGGLLWWIATTLINIIYI